MLYGFSFTSEIFFIVTNFTRKVRKVCHHPEVFYCSSMAGAKIFNKPEVAVNLCLSLLFVSRLRDIRFSHYSFLNSLHLTIIEFHKVKVR